MSIPKHLAIVAADFNKEIVEPMIVEAEKTAVELGYTTSVTRIPGCYEMPIVCHAVIQRGGLGAVVALGYIEKGYTLHGEVMGHIVQDALVQLQLEYRMPIGIGIIGPGATIEQARERNVSYGRAAVEAAVKTREIIG